MRHATYVFAIIAALAIVTTSCGSGNSRPNNPKSNGDTSAPTGGGDQAAVTPTPVVPAPTPTDTAGDPHNPVPTSCGKCHAKDVPAPNHYPAADCVACHTYPDWSVIKKFPHQPKPATCNSCHEKDRPQNHYGTRDCARCHNYPTWQI